MQENKAEKFFSMCLPWTRSFLSSRFVHYGFIGLILLYVLSYCVIPFSDGDPAYYVILGRGLLREHSLPYSYAFDHKPFGVYLFYGVWDQLFPVYPGKFTVLSLLLCGAFCMLCRAFGRFNRVHAFAGLVVFGAVFNVLAGNTELVLVTGEALILALMLRGVETGKPLLFFLAGFCAALVINVNYLAVVCLLAPAALLLFSPGWFRVSRVLLAFLGLCSGLGVLFSPYLIAGHGTLQAYFSMQRSFLHQYSGTLSQRLLCAFWMVFYLLLMVPVLVGWLRRFPVRLRQRDGRRNLILPAWCVSSFPATLMSGHPYEHYFILCFAPAVIMLAILLRDGASPSCLAMLPLCVTTLFFIGVRLHDNINVASYTRRVDYAGIARMVGRARVLDIRTYHAVFYLSDLKPFDVYLFANHIDILFRENAWKRYMQDLQQNPPYVVTPYVGCETHQVEAPVCLWLQEHYTLVYAANVRHRHRNKPNKFSLALYKLREPTETGAQVSPPGM